MPAARQQIRKTEAGADETGKREGRQSGKADPADRAEAAQDRRFREQHGGEHPARRAHHAQNGKLLFPLPDDEHEGHGQDEEGEDPDEHGERADDARDAG